MRSTALMVAVVMGVLYCGCDILAPPRPDYREINRQNMQNRQDRQIERLMKQIEELGKPSEHDAAMEELRQKIEKEKRESAGIDGGSAKCDEAAYQALTRELNECAARLEKCEGPPAKAKR